LLRAMLEPSHLSSHSPRHPPDHSLDHLFDLSPEEGFTSDHHDRS